MIVADGQITDVVFMYEGIDWLKWLVAFFFFVLGFFGGWWKWRYRRLLAARKGTAAATSKPKLSLSFDRKGEPPQEGESGSHSSAFGPVYDSKPEVVDDLQEIRGIGKALRSKLYSLGIYKFEQIAAWGDAEVAAISKKLQLAEQIIKEEWVEQAKSLQKGTDSS